MSRLFQKFKDHVHSSSSASSSQPPIPPLVPTWSKPDSSYTSTQMQRRPSKPDTSVMRVNAVYYPNYRIYRGDHESPATLNYSCITHVFYAFAKVEPDGVVLLSDEHADIQMVVDGEPKGCLGSLLHLKTIHPHLKLLISIGGGGVGSANFAAVAASTAKRDNFARSVHGLVTSAELDGVDIDWEHPTTPEDGANFLSLLAQIRIYLPVEEFLLTAALPAGAWALRHIDLCQAQPYLDFLNLMAYDFTGLWVPRTGHHAQLFKPPIFNPPGNDQNSQPCGRNAVQYVLDSGFASRKILLGIPVYGRSFLSVQTGQSRMTSSDHGSIIAARFLDKLYSGAGGEEGTYEYKDLPRPGTMEAVDTDAVAAFCVVDRRHAREFVTYDNPVTVRMKGEWAREQDLGGLFYWTGTGDIRSGPRSLVEAGFTALHRV